MDIHTFNPSALTRDDLDAVGVGVSSIVIRIKGTKIVAKTFPPLDKDQHSEQQIYEHLQSGNQHHPNILRYFGKSPPGCKVLRRGLLFEYHPRGTLSASFSKLDSLGISQAERSCWPRQALSAIAHIHSRGVVHGDVGLHNFLIDDDGRLVLCDFAGSGMAGIPATIGAGVRYANPQNSDKPYSTMEDDVFALGTVLYELERGERLFDGQDSRDIYRHLRDREFPDLSTIKQPLRNIIEKCWTFPEYRSSDALDELEGQSPFCRRISRVSLLGLGAALVSVLCAAWNVFDSN